MASLAALGVLPLVAAQDPAAPQRGLGTDVPETLERLDTYRQRHAIVVGVDHYRAGAYPDLAFAAEDARAMARLCVERLGFPPERVRLLIDDEATRAGLEAALQEWACDARAIGPDDLVVVFFAGHGETRRAHRGQQGFLVPSDARRDPHGDPAWSSLISMRDVEEVSEAIPAKHVLFVLDCCFGGLAATRSRPVLAPGLRIRARQVLCAGTADQRVLDGGGGAHSVFTGVLLEALSGAGDLDQDGVITFGELVSVVTKRVSAGTDSRQTPVFATLPDDGGGQVAFFPKGTVPAELPAADRLGTLTRNLQAQREEVDRLADLIRARDLEREAGELWPRWPERIPAMRAWLVWARELVARRGAHEDGLRKLREEVLLAEVLQGRIREDEAREPDWDEADEARRFRHFALVEILERLHTLARLVAEVEERVRFAETIERRSIGDHALAWGNAIEAISASPHYGGLRLAPQLGLVPIGADPASGLWEFWHVETGARAERDATTGKLSVANETGIVFVLVPPGRVRLGAVRPAAGEATFGPNVDPRAGEHERPIQDVTLDAYFLSKYEMTQGQWLRIAGANPSYHRSARWLCNCVPANELTTPVEEVSHAECTAILRRVGLVLPTEAQWEYAARAGSNTGWWTGDEVESLLGAANVDDADVADGARCPLPVGRLRPNRFGLHDTAGNVWEFCREAFLPYGTPVRAGDGERLAEPDAEPSPGFVDRGGAFDIGALCARSSYRSWETDGDGDDEVGVRPARAIVER